MRKIILQSIFILSIGIFVLACQSPESIEEATYYSNGKDIYKSKCQNCHGVNGEGLGELAPPLTDSLFLKQNKSRLACIIKNGLNESITIHQKTYNGKMPGLNFADIDIAQVIVYITNSFGNKQGMYSYKKVSEDLKNCK
ncbi:MAG: cytochrome c [Sphingobacteriaceae bacterium]|nr:cytochrome c [Sphingobacteriaceae bacterium]